MEFTSIYMLCLGDLDELADPSLGILVSPVWASGCVGKVG